MTLRLGADYGRLNEVNRKDRFPHSFHRLCLADPEWWRAFQYDVALRGRTVDEHLDVLRKVIQVGKASAPKLRTTENWGRVSGLRRQPEKTEAVRSWPAPGSPADIRRSLELTFYYHRFLKDYS